MVLRYNELKLSEEIEDFLDKNTYRVLLPFFIDYIKNHAYVKPKFTSRTFLIEKFNVSIRSELNDVFSGRISRSMSRLVRISLKESILIEYCSGCYKVVNVEKDKIEALKRIVKNF